MSSETTSETTSDCALQLSLGAAEPQTSPPMSTAVSFEPRGAAQSAGASVQSEFIAVSPSQTADAAPPDPRHGWPAQRLMVTVPPLTRLLCPVSHQGPWTRGHHSLQGCWRVWPTCLPSLPPSSKPRYSPWLLQQHRHLPCLWPLLRCHVLRQTTLAKRATSAPSVPGACSGHLHGTRHHLTRSVYLSAYSLLFPSLGPHGNAT